MTGDAANASHYLDVLPVPEPAHIGWNGSVDVVLRIVSQLFACESGVRVDRLVGDQIISMCIPYYVGGNHQLAAIEAAKALLRATGHDSADGPWIPLGVDVH